MKPLFFNPGELIVHHTYTECPQEDKFPLHAHDHFEIFCFLSGQGYYTVEGHDYSLTPGCVLIMRDNETHKLHISSERPYDRMAIHFSPRPFKNSPYESLLEPFLNRPLGQNNMLPKGEALSRVVDMMIHVTEPESKEEMEWRVLTYLPALLYEINSIIEANPAPQLRDSENLVKNIIEYINRDPGAVENVVAMESVFGYSRSYLNRTFRRSTGVPIWDYVILKRLTKARVAIRAGVPASVAATESGFVDYSSFFRQYRKRFGLTPEEDKRLAMQEESTSTKGGKA